MSTLNRAELRDLGRIDTLAREVLRQTNFLRLNMADHDTHDRIRFLFVNLNADRLHSVTSRCVRRYRKQEAVQ